VPLLVVSTGAAAHAQQPPRIQVMGQAVVALTHVNPVPRDSGLTELRVTQPVVALRVSRAGLGFLATLSLEGSTIPDGELTPGAWGEGFVDRRHPHTYAHELMLTWHQSLGPVRAGLAIGKGFAPFGTDDPMSRPTLRYPVNHHISQILERAVVLGSIAVGRVGLEAAAFNGDEPERPNQWPNVDRFGDSWSARVTVLPVDGVETQVSLARVASPEHRPGAASEQWKWSASARLERSLGRTPVYGLIEWARTSELEGFFVFHSVLVETAVTRGRHRPYVRIERTERPEEQRMVDPFRSQRPHLENSILGITRWTIATAGYTFAGPGRRVRLWPFAELSHAGVTNITGGVFDPALFYGRDTIWSFTLGLRLDAGMMGHRMGRYATPATTAHAH
jgi:hypothetical protein